MMDNHVIARARDGVVSLRWMAGAAAPLESVMNRDAHASAHVLDYVRRFDGSHESVSWAIGAVNQKQGY
jgi:hypothetical protein